MATERVQIEISESGGERVVNVFINIAVQAERAERSVSNFRRLLSALLAPFRALGRVAASTFRGLNSAIRNTTRVARTLVRGLLSIRTALLGLVAGAVLGGVTRITDGFLNLQRRISAFVPDAREGAVILNELFEIAQDARVPTDDVASVFQRLLIIQKDLNRSTPELIGFTESLTKAVKLSGASAAESGAALVQLSQGLASGTLRGDELRSVLEQLPFVARILADELGVGIGGLRELGAQGQITADKIFDTFENRQGEIEERFKRLPITITEAFQQIQNSISRTLGLLLGVSDTYAAIQNTLSRLSRFSDNVTTILSAGDEIDVARLKGIVGNIGTAVLESVKGLFARVRDVVFDSVRAIGTSIAQVAGPLFSSVVQNLGDRITVQVARILENVEFNVANSIDNVGKAIASGLDVIESAGIRIPGLSEFGNEAADTVRGVTTAITFGLREGGGSIVKQAEDRIAEFGDLGDRVVRAFVDLDNSLVASFSGDESPFALFRKGAEAEIGTLLASLGVAEAQIAALSDEIIGKLEEAGIDVGGRGSAKKPTFGIDEFASLVTAQFDLIGDRVVALGAQIGESVGGAIEDIVFEARSASEVFEGLARSISRAVFNAVVTQTVSGIVGGGLTGVLGSLFSSGTAAGSAGVAAVQSARGNVFDGGGSLVAFQRGGIAGGGSPQGFIRDTTIFPLRGGSIGVAGEAGTEIGTPARLGPAGELGVRVQRPSVTVNQTINMRERPNQRGDRLGRRQLAREASAGLSRVGGGSASFAG